VRGYATALAQWWTFLEQRHETVGWTSIGVSAVGGFLSWLRNGRTVEQPIARVEEAAPSSETLEARLAALISFYLWHAEVNDIPVAGKLRAAGHDVHRPEGCRPTWTAEARRHRRL
jgi:hypothetical protein